MAPIKVIAKPTIIRKSLTVDLSVDDRTNDRTPANSYSISTISGRAIVVHNTVSLLAGATPGVHFPISQYYIRRIRISNESPLVKALIAAGYNVEPCVGSEKTTSVVSFPVSVGKGVRTQKEVSVWEKLKLASFMQKYWADNQVSATIDFDKKTEAKDILPMLESHHDELKSISFLPRLEDSMPYPQMPYEEITEAQYNEMSRGLKPIDFTGKRAADMEEDKFCDGDKCVMPQKKTKFE
jgi:hypothetical protein